MVLAVPSAFRALQSGSSGGFGQAWRVSVELLNKPRSQKKHCSFIDHERRDPAMCLHMVTT